MTTASAPPISMQQLKILIVFFVVGDIAWFLPSITTAVVKQDAWVSAIVGMIIGWGIAAFLYWFSLQFPGKSLVGIHRSVLGKYVGGCFSLLFLIDLFMTSSSEVRAVSEFATTQIMSETPMYVLFFLITVVTVMALRAGLDAFSNAAQLFFVSFILLFVVLCVLQISEISMRNLLPVFNHGPLEIMAGAMYMIAFPYCKLTVFLMIYPDMERPSGSFRGYMTAVMLGGIMIFILVLLSILVLGSYLTEQQMYSTYIMAKKVNIGNFLQRLEFILVISYVLSTYFKCVIAFYATHRSFVELFGVRDGQRFIIPFGFMLFGFSYIIAPNAVAFMALATPWAIWEFVHVLLLIVFVYVVYRLRGGRGKGDSTA